MVYSWHVSLAEGERVYGLAQNAGNLGGSTGCRTMPIASVLLVVSVATCLAQQPTHPDYPGAVVVVLDEQIPVIIGTSLFHTFDSNTVYQAELWWANDKTARYEITKYSLATSIVGLEDFSPASVARTSTVAQLLMTYGECYSRPRSHYAWVHHMAEDSWCRRLNLLAVDVSTTGGSKTLPMPSIETNTTLIALTNADVTVRRTLIMEYPSGHVMKERWYAGISEKETNLVMSYSRTNGSVPRWFLSKPGDERPYPTPRQATISERRAVAAAIRRTSPLLESHDVSNEPIRYVGIGAFVYDDPFSDYIKIQLVGGATSPSALAGIQDGAVLIAVDGVHVQPLPSIQDIAPLLKGPAGTAVIIEALNPGQETAETFQVIRGEVVYTRW